MRIIKLDEYLAEKCSLPKPEKVNMATKGPEGDRWLLQGKKLNRQSSDVIGFPALSTTTAQPNSKSFSSSKQKSQNGTRHKVPPPGHEYDYRRTPETGRATPRHVSGQIRPSLPPDTLDMEGLQISETPIHPRTKHLRDKLDIGRFPTPIPLPTDTDNHVTHPLPSARSAWDNCGNTTYRSTAVIPNDLEEPMGEGLQMDMRIPAFPMHANRPFHDKVGRRFKPSHAPLKYDVIPSNVMDNEKDANGNRTNSPVNLTETVVNYYFQRPLNRDKRIARWLTDCEDMKQNQVPSHLPDINTASNRHVTIAFEES